MLGDIGIRSWSYTSPGNGLQTHSLWGLERVTASSIHKKKFTNPGSSCSHNPPTFGNVAGHIITVCQWTIPAKNSWPAHNYTGKTVFCATIIKLSFCLSAGKPRYTGNGPVLLELIHSHEELLLIGDHTFHILSQNSFTSWNLYHKLGLALEASRPSQGRVLKQWCLLSSSCYACPLTLPFPWVEHWSSPHFR